MIFSKWIVDEDAEKLQPTMATTFHNIIGVEYSIEMLTRQHKRPHRWMTQDGMRVVSDSMLDEAEIEHTNTRSLTKSKLMGAKDIGHDAASQSMDPIFLENARLQSKQQY